MIFAVVFGLSIDYAVFLLSRMRERYDAGDGNAAAVRYGLEKTARVITGAAVIMLAVFIVFAGAPIATVSQLGIGLTVAVVLDATVVRIVLLPALMLLLGDRVWWMPRPLARVLPRWTSSAPAVATSSSVPPSGAALGRFRVDRGAVGVAEGAAVLQLLRPGIWRSRSSSSCPCRSRFLLIFTLKSVITPAPPAIAGIGDVEARPVAFLAVVGDDADQDQGGLQRFDCRRRGAARPVCRPGERR